MSTGGKRRAATLSRRSFVAGSAATALAWTPMVRVPVALAHNVAPFPTGVGLYREGYQNWAREIVVDDLLTCAPRTPADVLRVVRWARAAGYRVRARGMRHNWSPLTVANQDHGARVLLVDTTQHLRTVEIRSWVPGVVRAQTGVTLDDLLVQLEHHGLGVTAAPSPGNVTLGGALAINGHGAAIPARGEVRPEGATYGSLSNLVLSLTAVVWNPTLGDFELRTFERDDPACAALLTHLGGGFLTDATLQVQSNPMLRCVSRTDISVRELFAPPGSPTRRTFAALAQSTGRLEAIWFPFTDHPWIKVWSVCPTKPKRSRAVADAYNYPFTDELLPENTSDLLSAVAHGASALTPAATEAMFTTVAVGLDAFAVRDIWGPSRNLLHYVRSSTLRATTNGFAVHLRRRDVQRAVSLFARFHQRQLLAYRRRGLYPMNLPVEMRLTSLDRSSECRRPGAVTPLLSALAPRTDRPDWDTVLWLNLTTLPGTPGANRFYREFETWALRTFSGDWALARPEWAKGFAYTDDGGAWTNPDVLHRVIPARYGDSWPQATAALGALDPHGVFRNRLLDVLLER